MGLAGASWDELIPRSTRSRLLNSGRGKSRNSTATLSRSAMLASTAGSGKSGLAIIAWTASSSCSLKLALAIRITRFNNQLRSQCVERAELQLLDRTLAAAKLVRDFANTLLLRKSHTNDPPLIRRKPTYEMKQACPLFNPFVEVLKTAVGRRFDGRRGALLRLPIRPIDDGIGSNLEEPCCKRST